MDRFIGPFLIAVSLAHLLVGVATFSGPLKDIWEGGVFDGVTPDGASVSAHYDRMAAVWFLLFAPVLLSLGQIVSRAVQRGDSRILRVIAVNFLGIGVAGVVLMPISGFWILIGLVVPLLRAASQAQRQVNAPAI